MSEVDVREYSIQYHTRWSSLRFATGLKPCNQRAEGVWKIGFVNFNRVSDSSFFNGKLILEPVSARP
jgi:hypothetical protein